MVHSAAMTMLVGIVWPFVLRPFKDCRAFRVYCCAKDVLASNEDCHFARNSAILAAIRRNSHIFSRELQMHDTTVAASFDNDKRIGFVQGEDRTFLLRLFDPNVGAAIDLTGANVAVHLPGSDCSIKRRSGALTVNSAQANALFASSALAVNDAFYAQSHGFVSGETVVVTSAPTGMLPATLVANVAYIVNVINANQFYLLAEDNQTVNLGSLSSSSYAFLLTQQAPVIIDIPVAGQCTIFLPSIVTQAVSAGHGQDYQIVLSDAQGLTRIVAGVCLLDCSAQPLP